VVNLFPSGVSAATAAGDVQLNFRFTVTGVSAATAAGGVLIWNEIVPGQTTRWGETVPGQTANWTQIAA